MDRGTGTPCAGKRLQFERKEDGYAVGSHARRGCRGPQEVLGVRPENLAAHGQSSGL